ncbi:translation machinery-associated protein 16 [Ophidiomyces ophidiicola]|nr:translation machinery-associated protein 16 [Ophidiomyces ophidiicola]
MTKNLQKVQKQISKKRGALDALHANSRDSKRLRRASAREIKLARVAAEHVMGRQIYLDRVSFFKSYITEITIPLSDNDMSQLIDKLALLPTLLLVIAYLFQLHRNEEEVDHQVDEKAF